ncbi:hypothetical protein EP10_000608 [Geobacillus icigianus]|uniref:Uncharacterized protein n=1 Tax=Geobacillus icigianus TaxID=1430331 RepID=A0ABU6BCZ2_9BACL|nr:hypothetical protein [Geobacillus icigianus]
MSKWWMIRAGDRNELIPLWLEKGIASIGWAQLGNPRHFSSKQQLQQKADEVFNEAKPKSRNSWVNQVWRFNHSVRNTSVRYCLYDGEQAQNGELFSWLFIFYIVHAGFSPRAHE